MAEKVKKYVPEYRGQLRDHCIEIPRCITQASGIRIFGRRIKSLVFTTDIAIIRNINADAVIAVYPFTPQPAITHAILTGADMPVFSGVGGGITGGARVVSLAMDAEALYLSVGLINTSYKEEYSLWVNSEDKVIATWRPNVTYLPEEPDMVWKFTGTFE